MSDHNPDPPVFRPPSGQLTPETSTPRDWKQPESPKEVFLQRTRRWLLAGALLLFVLGLGAFFGARPAYHQFKTWRGRQLAAQSLKLSAEGKLADARTKSESAFRLAPNDPAVIRAFATALAGSGQLPQAGGFFTKLVALGQATPADRQALIEICLWARFAAEAQAQLEQLVALSGENATTLLLSSRLNQLRGELSAALADARRAVELVPDDDSARISLAGLKLQSVATSLEGEKELMAFGTKKTESGLRALTLLANSPELSIPALSEVAASLEAHPLAVEIHRLKALELRCRAHPLERAALLDEAHARYSQPATDPQMRSELAGLLLGLEEPERVLKSLPLKEALTRGEWLPLHLDALSMLRRWEEILAALENGTEVLPKPVIELYRARCFEETGDLAKANEHWQRGLSLAAGDAGLLLYFARYAEKLGKNAEARGAYRAMSSLPEAALYAKEQLARLGQK